MRERNNSIDPARSASLEWISSRAHKFRILPFFEKPKIRPSFSKSKYIPVLIEPVVNLGLGVEGVTEVGGSG
jgi:hypothetical protein